MLTCPKNSASSALWSVAMAGFVTWISFDWSKLDFSSIATYADLLKPELKKDYNLSDGKITYPDALIYYWFIDDNNFGVSAFAGKDFSINANDGSAAGIVEAYVEIALPVSGESTSDRFVINGLNAPLSDIRNAIKSKDTSDDYSILKANFTGSNIFVGSNYDDKLVGYEGDDLFVPGIGNDEIDAGAGRNILFLQGAKNEYKIAKYDESIQIIDTVENRDGTDTVKNFTKVSFTDGSLILGSADKIDKIYLLYDAIFNRIPDADGLEFWSGQDNQLSATNTQTQFIAPTGLLNWADFIKYAGQDSDNTNYIGSLYQLTLGRKPDVSGLNFWVDQLVAGQSREQIYDNFTHSFEYANIVKIADNFLKTEEASKFTGLTNKEFISNIISNLSGNAADPLDVDLWSNILSEGVSKAVAVVGITLMADKTLNITPDGNTGYWTS